MAGLSGKCDPIIAQARAPCKAPRTVRGIRIPWTLLPPGHRELIIARQRAVDTWTTSPSIPALVAWRRLPLPQALFHGRSPPPGQDVPAARERGFHFPDAPRISRALALPGPYGFPVHRRHWSGHAFPFRAGSSLCHFVHLPDGKKGDMLLPQIAKRPHRKKAAASSLMRNRITQDRKNRQPLRKYAKTEGQAPPPSSSV